MIDEIAAIQRRADRERLARKQAEKLLEEKSLELYQANQLLKSAAEKLEEEVQVRTAELKEALVVAKHAAQAKGDFLAMMSHEIRTPLNGIIGSANILLMSETISQEDREFAEIIHRSGDSLLVLINDILDFSKIEAGGLELEPHPTPLIAELDGMLALYRPLADERNVALKQDFSPNLPDALLLDGLRLRQIIGNLISNAIKFTHAGSVTLDVRWDALQSRLQVSVHDTGIGIPHDRIDRLFKPFSQADSSTTRKYGGTGLGLVICSRLVDAMGGKIEVTSEPGQGSTFSFSISAPRADAPEKHISADPMAATSAKLRILLVEDNEVNQIVARRILEKLGQSADLAENGLKALDQASRFPYDVILMDMQMPEMDGLEATKAIRQLGLSPRPRIIGLTANAFDSDREKCMDAGMDDFLTKPLRVDDLREKLNAMDAGKCMND